MIESQESKSASETPEQPLVKVRRLGAGASGGLSLLLVGSLFAVPILGLLIAPLGLIPVLHHQVSAKRWYLGWSWVAVLLAVASVSGFGGITGPLLGVYVLIVVLPSVSIELWRRQRGWTEGRWAAATALTGAIACLIAVAILAAPLAPVEAVAGWFRDTASQAAEFYSSMGLARGEVDLALDAVELYASWVFPSFPVAYLIAVLFWVRPRLAVLGFEVPVEPFERYRSEEWLPAGFAIFGLGTLLLAGTARWVVLNLLITVLILYFVHGLAIIRAHLTRWIGRGWLVRWGVVLICLQMPFPPLVVILGVADSFYPMRPRANDDGGQHEGDPE